MPDNNTSNSYARPLGVQNHFIDMLVNMGFVDRTKLSGFEDKSEIEIGKYLANGICTSEQIARAFSAYFNLPYASLRDAKIDYNVLKIIPFQDAKSYNLVAFALENKDLKLAIGDPAILQSQPPEILKKLTDSGYVITLHIVPMDDLLSVITQYEQSSVPPVLSANLQPTNGLMAQTAGPSTQVSQQIQLPFVDLSTKEIPYEVIIKFPKDVALKYKMVVFETDPPIDVSKATKKIKVALLDPNDIQGRDILEFIRKRNNLEVTKFKCDQAGYDKAMLAYDNKEVQMPDQKDQQKDSEPSSTKEEIKSSPIQPDVIQKAEDRNKEDKIQKVEEHNKEEKRPIETETEEVKQMKAPDLNKPLNEVIESKQIDDSDINKDPNVPQEKKIGQMHAIASTVLKSEDERIKEGVVAPYSTGVEKPKVITEDAVREVKAEDIDSKAGLSHSEMEDNLEENNLDKFLTKPVDTIEDLESVIKAGMVPEIVAGIVSLGIVMQISDVHLEATTENVRLRFRIDGILKDIIRMPLSLHAPLVSRIKILSKLKIDEQRVPQDGRFDVIVRKHEIDLRVSTLPTVHGEKVVMRILDKSVGILTLEDMGITGVGFDILIKNIKKPYGIILATGPTGSGKSTTLYAVLQRISTTSVNVITLEDPVEYEIPGINQTQVKPQIGFTFAEGLRSVLRQDPNIIMVGEIRDLETAAMATHAALTGHLVLSTLHTNDSAGALPRLINMGVEPFLITSSVNCIVAQRLVRKICPNCKEKVNLPEALIEEILKEISKIPDTKISAMKKDDLEFFHGKGCPSCTNGYHGRIGIYEVLEMNEKIEALAVDKQPASAIAEQACKDGMITMKQDGILKALKGITTMDEVLRVTSSD